MNYLSFTSYGGWKQKQLVNVYQKKEKKKTGIKFWIGK